MSNWLDDLFGGQDKGWVDKNDGHEGRMSRTADDIKTSAENKTKDYPHYTRENQSDWHRSEDKNTHSSSWNIADDSRYSPEPDNSGELGPTTNEGNDFNLFDPSTWM